MSPEFDHLKWTFWLVACVIAWLLALSTEFLTFCLLWPAIDHCKTDGRFTEFLGQILPAVMAFAAGIFAGKITK